MTKRISFSVCLCITHMLHFNQRNLLSACLGRHIWCQSSPSPAGWDGGRWGQTGTDLLHPAEKTKNGERSRTDVLYLRTQRRVGTWKCLPPTPTPFISAHIYMITPSCRRHQRKISYKAHLNTNTAAHQQPRPLRSPTGHHEKKKKDLNISRPPGETCESYQIFIGRQQPPVKSWGGFCS